MLHSFMNPGTKMRKKGTPTAISMPTYDSVVSAAIPDGASWRGNSSSNRSSTVARDPSTNATTGIITSAASTTAAMTHTGETSRRDEESDMKCDLLGQA